MSPAIQESRELAALRAYTAEVRAARLADPRPMSPYERDISAATGLTNLADLAEVEDMMRLDRCALDDLDEAAFAALARECYAACLAGADWTVIEQATA